MMQLTKTLSLIMFFILFVTGIAFAECKQPIQLSEEQSQELSTFFSRFSVAFLQPFANGQITDDSMVSFALIQLKINRGYKNLQRRDDYHWAASAGEIDHLTAKYFGKVVSSHRSVQNHPFADGYYLSPYATGEAVRFSRIQALYDNGDGTFSATVRVYYGNNTINWMGGQYTSIKAKEDGTFIATEILVYPDGTTGIFEIPRIRLGEEYSAVIKPVYSNGDKRYILLEYIKTREFH